MDQVMTPIQKAIEALQFVQHRDAMWLDDPTVKEALSELRKYEDHVLMPKLPTGPMLMMAIHELENPKEPGLGPQAMNIYKAMIAVWER